MHRMFTVYLITLCLLTSCGGTFSYKRGARPEALSVAKADCHANNKNDAQAVNECLEQQGWSVYELDDMALFATASESSTENGGRFIDVPTEKTAKKEATTHATNALPSDGSAAKETQAQSTVTKPKSIPSPDTLYKVSSWWKWGGGQTQLEADLANCEAKLGDKHKPDFSQQLVTRAFVVCMVEKGWKALKAK